MGYTTKFSGAVILSRPLTITEAKELLSANLDNEAARNLWPTGKLPDGYLQWVPSEDLGAIVWDDGEKFYDYTKWMVLVCKWLGSRGIQASGDIHWQGEETGDVGTLHVLQNGVEEIKGRRVPATNHRPLTMNKLGEMALEKLTGPE